MMVVIKTSFVVAIFFFFEVTQGSPVQNGFQNYGNRDGRTFSGGVVERPVRASTNSAFRRLSTGAGDDLQRDEIGESVDLPDCGCDQSCPECSLDGDLFDSELSEVGWASAEAGVQPQPETNCCMVVTEDLSKFAPQLLKMARQVAFSSGQGPVSGVKGTCIVLSFYSDKSLCPGGEI